MRFKVRGIIVTALAVAGLATSASANHLTADCPLTFVGQVAPTSEFQLSPHGVFRNGSSVYVLRGRSLTTLTASSLGELTLARQDTLNDLHGVGADGATTYADGYLYIASEAGLEIFDLRNTRADGTAPVFTSRAAAPHYRRMSVSGNLLAATYPIEDMPCVAGVTPGCQNTIDIWSIADPANPTLVSRISSNNNLFVGFNDVQFLNGFLWATGVNGTFAFNMSNPAAPATAYINPTTGSWLETNGSQLLAIGQETLIGVFTVGPGARLNYFAVLTLPAVVDRGNQIMFHPQAAFDGSNRLVTMIDEKDPLTLRPARTIAFDVFDFGVPLWEGSVERIYENVSWVTPNELKWDPAVVGSYVYVNGEMSGTQAWGACGMLAGRIEFDNFGSLPCGGAQLRGWVTGTGRVSDVEVYLDDSRLGAATLGAVRTDIPSRTPVVGWALNVNLDQVSQGDHLLRAIATDANGNRRQIASQAVYFGGPGRNCTTRRRFGR